MDVRNQPRERVFSILNDNDCPSFVIRQRRSQSPERKSPRSERPSLFRHTQYKRTSSFSSTGSSPPLLRFDSSSSKSSSSSMDSSPSPITPAYNFGDPNVLCYDNVLRQDLAAYMPSSSTITPFMENSLMIAPNVTEQYPPKVLQQPMVQYPILPAPSHADIAQLPTPASSSNSAATSMNNTSPANPGSGPTNGKKNKYPCPYAQSHNCSATFTTSGHAARHGKKHTGEKGVHCPVCNKAFTRKDNMKQHERTHKESNVSNSEDANARRSKAAVTREAQRNKQVKKQDSDSTSISDLASASSTMKQSPPSDNTSLEPPSELPLGMGEPSFFAEPSGLLMPQQPIPENISPPGTIYPPLTDEGLLTASTMQPMDSRLPSLVSGNVPMPPALVRGFSDLDTLAQAAESFDPCYQQNL